VRARRKSRGSASNPAPDALALALGLLAQRELSESQLRSRLARRGCGDADIETAIDRLRQDRTLDDARVARAAARLEAAVRRRGPLRVRQRLAAMGLDPDTVDEAVRGTFEEHPIDTLLDDALTRRLRGRTIADLDDKARARLIRGLVGQGFPLSAVLKRVRRVPE
jgi:regulatory protein